MTFTASVSNPYNSTLTFAWDFGDGGSASGNPATHSFSTEGTFQVSVKVSDGFNTVSSSVSVQAFAPASGGTGGNVSTGTTVTNPLSDVSIKVLSGDGGVVELDVTFTGTAPAGIAINTIVNDPQGNLVSVVSGSKPVIKFSTPGVYVATTAVTDADGKVIGQAKITLPIGAAETGSAVATTPPASQLIEISGLKGKFLFQANKPDAVSFKGSFELPGGLDLSLPQEMTLGIGNVLDKVTLSPKGKATAASALGRIKKIQMKYPKLAKGVTKTGTGQRAAVSFTMSVPDLDTLGFGAEGISATVRPDEAALSSVQRTIQVAMVLAGTTYAGGVGVDFKLSKKKDIGQLLPGRR